MKVALTISISVGALGAVLLYLSLQNTGHGRYHRNPFALKQSGYGMMLARLGQTNLERAWHYGSVASELSRERKDEHAGHDHAEHAGHDHEGEESLEQEKGMSAAVDFLVALDGERFRRTSKFVMTQAQQERIGRDIEGILSKGYNMDPTDYANYEAYYHFLLFHETRRSARDRKKAYFISEHTIQEVFKDKEDPLPWLTASSATMNQFFLHQANYRKEKGAEEAQLPVETLIKYQDRMKYCLGHYLKLKKDAVEAGNWQKMAPNRREDADKRAMLSEKIMEQFQSMIDRQQQD